ncbi:hypothetical protein HHK36_010285 [Tetracentron sinense]|uniref:Dirigent protein n=1 Tax=Tetracentron sinense TaxID=13715 RepID=A0A834ZKJ6_TETSI|nr:hypothetical protein HHK36_010285 [Tetracentron sinense]
MEGRLLFLCAMVLCISIAAMSVHCEYHKENPHHGHMKEKKTHLHFYLHDILSGKKPSAIMVAHTKTLIGINFATPFGTVYAIDDPLTEGPEPTSKVIGNAQGLYVSSAQDILSLVMYVDFAFTTGKYNGSSLSVFSRNPVMEGDREIAVVGGRGKFRMARGFAELKTTYFNTTNGDAIIEYKVTILHY